MLPLPGVEGQAPAAKKSQAESRRPRHATEPPTFPAISGVRQPLRKDSARALCTELLSDVAAGVDEDVSHVSATILIAGEDEVPGITRIGLSPGSRE